MDFHVSQKSSDVAGCTRIRKHFNRITLNWIAGQEKRQQMIKVRSQEIDMTERLGIIEIGTQLIYYVFSSLMLFWALWKCFWDGKRNRIVLFILTALSNSMIGLFLAVYGGISFSMSVIEPLFLRVLGYSMPYRIAEVTPFLIAGPLYIARILFMAWLCGKWLQHCFFQT